MNGQEMREKILEEISKEQQNAVKHWCGDTDKYDFDDENTINDWVSYITDYASSAGRFGKSKEQSRIILIKTGGLVLSTLMALERNGEWKKRHYDK